MDGGTMSEPNPLHVVILAAGLGKRMNSARPKVLHELAGRPLLEHVLSTAAALGSAELHVVVGHGADQVRERFGDRAHWVYQREQRGTGHAVALALEGIEEPATVLVLYGDVPLVTGSTLSGCVRAAGDGLALVTARVEDPAGLGRIVRDAAGGVVRIVEDRDATAADREIREINSGILAMRAGPLRRLLAEVGADNAQGEIYLTDVVALAVAAGLHVTGIGADPVEVQGVNDRAQLAVLERAFQRREVRRLMAAGVTVADPERIDIRGSVSAGRDCFIDVNVVFAGDIVLGEGVSIGAGAVIADSVLGDGVRVEPHTVVDGARVAARCVLGPFARIRPGTELGEDVRIGNFVETKKARLGRGTKASHLTYLGDATIGEDCNVGAGTVTCNYAGVDKHETHIGDRVFVGTNSTLVAPLEVESDAFVAAGSTITTRVRAEELAVGRGKQRNIRGWVRPDRRARGKHQD
jgi:bifunctional UDP-N-acetylglucosamine pyrophosphorylase/glucosamine-1-phosphate N-acetyltransferase